MIEKIRKLLALARNAGATEAEAAQALGMANALMLKHGIEQDQVDEEDELVKSGARQSAFTQRWHQMLAISLGRMYGCQCLFERRTDHFTYIGRDEANQAAQLTLEFVVDQINMFYRLSLPKGLSQRERAQYRRDFKHACTSRVLDRVEEIIAESMTDEGAAAIGCTALVVRDHRQQRLDEAQEFALKEPGSALTEVGMSSRKSVAGVAGRHAGDHVQINAEVEAA